MTSKNGKDLVAENQTLREQLAEAQETLRAIHQGEVDALVVSTPEGLKTYTMSGAEKPYRLLIEQMHEGAVMLSEDNFIMYCNKGFADVARIPLEKIMNSKIEKLISPVNLESFKAILTIGRAGKGPATAEITLKGENGILTPALVSVNYLKGDSTLAATTFIVATDLTKHMEEDIKRYTADLEQEIIKRKKAQEELKASEEQFRRAIEEAPIPIIMQAEDGEVLQISKTWTTLTGYTIHNIQLFDQWVTTVVYGEGADEVRDHLRTLFKGKKGAIDVEFVIRTAKGTFRNWSFSASSPGRLTDGRRFIVGMAVDITERKKAEIGLKERTEQLEITQQQLEESAVHIEEYANQMEELAQERLERLKGSERLAAIGATAGMVGHDIRNPLQAITSDAFLAKTELDALPNSEPKKMALESIEEITKETEYINKIVQDLQDFARPLNPRMEEVDLKTVIDGIAVKNGLPKNINLQIKIPDNVRIITSDPYYLNRIFANLVSNSVQAMPRGGNLTIQAHKEDKETVISVQDTGVGIPLNIQDKMFTIMFTTKAKGQGFGLPVVKRMTESLGGKVTFESEEGKGTTFKIRLPSPKMIKGNQ